MAFDVTVIAGAVLCSELALQRLGVLALPVTAVALVLIGARQHALGVLMHDGIHGGLLPGRAGHVLSQLLIWPLLITPEGYRKVHIAHHAQYGTSGDPNRMVEPDGPEWSFPMPPLRMASLLLRDLTGLSLLSLLSRIRRVQSGEPSRRSRGLPGWCRWLVLATLAGGVIASGLWLHALVYWVLPILTVLPALLRLRVWLEHAHVRGSYGTRTTLAGPLGRLLVLPHNSGYHVEHHHYASVRFQHLPELHRLLVDSDAYNPDEEWAPSILAALRRIARARPNRERG